MGTRIFVGGLRDPHLRERDLERFFKGKLSHLSSFVFMSLYNLPHSQWVMGFNSHSFVIEENDKQPPVLIFPFYYHIFYLDPSLFNDHFHFLAVNCNYV